MNIYSRTGKHFESAVGCPVDFVIGCVQSGKVLGLEDCYTVTSLPAFTLNAVHRVCALLCTANTVCDLFILCFCCGSLGCKCA